MKKGKGYNKKCLICKDSFLVKEKRKESAKYCSNECRLKTPIRPKEYKYTIEHRKKISLSHIGKKILKNRGESNYLWKGNGVTYGGLHHWIVSILGKPGRCEHCGVEGLSGHQIHWANKSQQYKRVIDDWVRLCAKCHKQYDKGKEKIIPKRYAI